MYQLFLESKSIVLQNKMGSFETYLEIAKDIRTKMKELLAMDASEFVKNPEYFGEIRLVMREILPLSSDLLETMRMPMKNHYMEELKKTNDAMKKMVEREATLKQMISGMDTVTIIKVAKNINQDKPIMSKPIVKVKEYVTEDFEKRGYKCNEITGLPDELGPWYGHHIEHGRILHKRLNAWLDEKEEKAKKARKEAKKKAKAANSGIIDASNALLSL